MVTEPEPGTILAGRYRLEAVIGRGGMGAVWRATDRRLKREVALKLIARRTSSEERTLLRFEQEAVAIAALRSPYVVQIFDYGVHGRSPFMVMEMLQGCSLSTRLAERSRLDPPEVVRIVSQTARALAAAHERSIVHRDLKPANIFLLQHRDEEMVKVLDFGLAKILTGPRRSRQLTRVGTVLGTPAFMSPEQILTDPVDHRSDLWSLGVVSFVALTGYQPFDGPEADVLEQICTQRPPSCSELCPHLPVEVDAFFDKALAKRPRDRFQDAVDMSTELARVLGLPESSGLSVSRDSFPSLPPRDRPSGPETASTVVDENDPTTRPVLPHQRPELEAPPAGTAPTPAVADSLPPPTRDDPATTSRGAEPPRQPRRWRTVLTITLVALAALAVGASLWRAYDSSMPSESAASVPSGAAPGAGAERPATPETAPPGVEAPSDPPRSSNPALEPEGPPDPAAASSASSPPAASSPSSSPSAAHPTLRPGRPARGLDVFNRPWIE